MKYGCGERTNVLETSILFILSMLYFLVTFIRKEGSWTENRSKKMSSTAQNGERTRLKK